MGTEVVVEGLTKSFGRHVVWRDISLALPAGEVSVMLGPSGTGKTVFLKSLVGLIRPDRGRVVVDGIVAVTCGSRAKTSRTSPNASCTRSARCSASCSRTARCSAR